MYEKFLRPDKNLQEKKQPSSPWELSLLAHGSSIAWVTVRVSRDWEGC